MPATRSPSASRPYARDDALAVLGHRLECPAGEGPRDHAASRSAAIAAWPSASCCMPAAPPRSTWKGPPPGTACCPATIAARGPCSTPSTGWPTATTARCDTARQDLAIAEGQLRDYEARLGRPFAHDAYLSELTGLRDQLKAGLSQATPEPGTSRAGCRTGRADQGPESRPHHRRRPRADGPPPHRRRGAGHRPHPPPEPKRCLPSSRRPSPSIRRRQGSGGHVAGRQPAPTRQPGHARSRRRRDDPSLPEAEPPRPPGREPAYRQHVARGPAAGRPPAQPVLRVPAAMG